MACIEHYVEDAENIFKDIQEREKSAQSNAFVEYRAATAIQRWYRGFITRKHLKHLHDCATVVQKYWRRYIAQKTYFKLLQEAVHKMYWEHYNSMATKIQKVWRGHFVRTRVFSYYKLKEYIKCILQKNQDMFELAQRQKREVEEETQRRMQEECREWLEYLSFKVHHLVRTRQIEGVFSKRGTQEYSSIEKHLKNIKFTDYIDKKRKKERQKPHQEPNYIFKGRLRECERAWRDRDNPGKFSLATGEYGLDEKLHKEEVKKKNILSRLQDTNGAQKRQMKFGGITFNDMELKLGTKQYQCPRLHRVVKPAQQ